MTLTAPAMPGAETSPLLASGPRSPNGGQVRACDGSPALLSPGVTRKSWPPAPPPAGPLLGGLPATWASCPLALAARLLASTSAFVCPWGSRPDASKPLVAAQLCRPTSQEDVGAWLHPPRVPRTQGRVGSLLGRFVMMLMVTQELRPVPRTLHPSPVSHTGLQGALPVSPFQRRWGRREAYRFAQGHTASDCRPWDSASASQLQMQVAGRSRSQERLSVGGAAVAITALEQQVQGPRLQGVCAQPGRPGLLSAGAALQKQGSVSAQDPWNLPPLVTCGSWGEAAAGPWASHLPPTCLLAPSRALPGPQEQWLRPPGISSLPDPSLAPLLRPSCLVIYHIEAGLRSA